MQLDGEYQAIDSGQWLTHTHKHRLILTAVQGDGSFMAGSVCVEDNWDLWACIAGIEKGENPEDGRWGSIGL